MYQRALVTQRMPHGWLDDSILYEADTVVDFYPDFSWLTGQEHGIFTHAFSADDRYVFLLLLALATYDEGL